MRSLFSVAHRWAGLTIAVFLFVAGITGAIVSWDHELDDLLNPHLMNAAASGPAIPSLELARQVEARNPQIVVADTPRAEEDPIAPTQSFETILERARSEADRRGWTQPAGSIFYSQSYGVFGVTFYEPGADHGAAGVGNPQLFYDGGDGQFIGDFVPWRGTAGDLFLQVQFPLHSGRIAGLPGRILVSFMGLVVAALSVTGVVIWYRKRIARLRRTAKGTSAAGTRRPEIPAAAE